MRGEGNLLLRVNASRLENRDIDLRAYAPRKAARIKQFVYFVRRKLGICGNRDGREERRLRRADSRVRRVDFALCGGDVGTAFEQLRGHCGGKLRQDVAEGRVVENELRGRCAHEYCDVVAGFCDIRAHRRKLGGGFRLLLYCALQVEVACEVELYPVGNELRLLFADFESAFKQFHFRVVLAD